ncbi:MAG TPA: aminotransferase class V-fold PLP-dependent enzyme, partial [Candidatus Latescibacteria bacterium]|nr:aminotransferase class V-fold PLP-dependent enzyme [Candidatus Latescibacterota bacterium]
LCRNKNIFLHTDAAQSLGKIPANVRELGVDFLTVAGHKLYAPKGIGATYIRRGIHIEPLIHGAGHESGRRAGTENVIFDVALGKACEIAGRHLTNNQIKELTGYLHGRLMEAFGPRIRLNGHPSERLPNTLNISFVGFEGHVIMDKMVDTAVSTGSACHTGLTAISPVLKAMNVNEEIARGAVRFSLGRYTTKDEIDALMERLQNIIQ